MTFEQARLVRQTYQRIAHIPPQTVGAFFYGRLVETAPEIRPLFNRTALPEQSAKLVAMLTYVIKRLDYLDSSVEDLSALARHHQRYGVQEHHYAHVGQALLWTLRQTLGSDWTPEVREAWMACYTLLADTMISATRPSIASLRPLEPYPLSYAPGY